LVVSVALLLFMQIVSIYGMNFKYMPELDQTWGYPLALALMVGSVTAPFIYFRRKGWLR
jgi:magnesium transporter